MHHVGAHCMHGSKCDQVSLLNITGKLKVVVAIGDEQRIIVEIIMYDYLGTSYYRIVGCLSLMVAHKSVILYMFLKLAGGCSMENLHSSSLVASLFGNTDAYWRKNKI
jgi:hypothetical protein